MSKIKDVVIDDLNNKSMNKITELQKVIEEKNTLIADFKRYDEERKIYIRRLEKRIITLRNKNRELNKRITI